MELKPEKLHSPKPTAGTWKYRPLKTKRVLLETQHFLRVHGGFRRCTFRQNKSKIVHFIISQAGQTIKLWYISRLLYQRKAYSYSWKTGEGVTFCVRLFLSVPFRVWFGSTCCKVPLDFQKIAWKVPPKNNSKFAPENRPTWPKRKGSSSNHQFSGAKMLVSWRN